MDKESKYMLSPEVNDLMRKMPGGMLKYGSLFFLLFMLALLLISWLIRYPDLVEGTTTIKTVNPPVRLISKSPGELQIFVADNEKVKKGQVIGEVRSVISAEAVDVLREVVSKRDSFQSNYTISNALTFGDMQPVVNELREYQLRLQALMEDARVQNEINSLKKQLLSTNRLIATSEAELRLKKSTMDAHKDRLAIYEELYQNKAISKLDFLNEQNRYNDQQLELSSMQKALTRQELNRDQMQFEVDDLVLKRDEELEILRQRVVNSLDVIENFIRTYQRNYQFIAPEDGVLSHLSDLHDGLYVMPSTPVFAIVPEEEQYYASMQVSQKGFGKVEQGQRVIIELEQYAPYEYGVLYGVVEEISLVQAEENQRVMVSLPDNLMTSFKYHVSLPPESTAKGKIVTEDIRLLQRFFRNFQKVIRRK